MDNDISPMTDFMESVQEMTDRTRKYYRTPSEKRRHDRQEMLYSLDIFKTNPSFDLTATLRETFVKGLQLILRANSVLLNERDFLILEPFVRRAAINAQLTFPDKGESDTVFPDGLWADTVVRISLSNEHRYNVHCLAHEIGHLIHQVKIADESTLAAWERDDSFPVGCAPGSDDDPKQELIAEIVALGVLKLCGMGEYETLKAILAEASVSGDTAHKIPRELLLAFSDRNPLWKIDWLERAVEAIRLYICNTTINIDRLFAGVIGKLGI